MEGRQRSLVQTSTLKTDYSLLALSCLNWGFRLFYKKAPLARVVEKWWMTSSSRSHVLRGHGLGKRGTSRRHPPAPPGPLASGRRPRALRAPHRRVTPARPPTPETHAPHDLGPEPPERAGGGTGAGKHGASPVVRVRGQSLAEGRVRGFGEKILKIHPLSKSGSSVDSHLRVRREKIPGAVLARRACATRPLCACALLPPAAAP